MSRKLATDRREDIVNATVDLFLRHGLTATTTRDVTQALGVGTGLLNHYFRWSELRAEAFARIVGTDLERALHARENEPATVVMTDLVRDTFDRRFDALWRVWIEAFDAANEDPALAERLTACTEGWRRGLVALLRRGESEGSWSCPDPEGASWRLLALLDGLLGMTLASPTPPMSRTAAAKHWRIAIAHECGWEPDANKSRKRRA